MSVRLRRRRILGSARPAWVLARTLPLTLFCGLLAGCNGTPDRQPVPNPAPVEPATRASAGEAKAPPDDDAAAERYLEIKAKLEADPGVAKGPEFPALRAELEGIANGAGAAPMRANAALVLGSMFEVRGDHRKAAGFYQHAATLVPDDAGPHMALAVAHAAAGELAEAAKAQAQASTLDPDNLENWLALGELRMRAGDEEGSAQAYVAYELRRKGLIDGLTLHDADGTPVVSAEDRIGCAEALAAAADQGTGYALLYALRRDPEPSVRAAVARVMGIQRLDMYLSVLHTHATQEADADVKETVAWALAEIARDPVKIEPTERPRLADDDPRATDGELPRADVAPTALTDDSTLAPADAGAPAPSGDAPAPSEDAPAPPP